MLIGPFFGLGTFAASPFYGPVWSVFDGFPSPESGPFLDVAIWSGIAEALATMKTNVPQLQIETKDDGAIDLEQNDETGNVVRITLHPIHVRYLFEIAGHLVKPEPIDVPVRIATLERRLIWLKHRFNECGAELPYDFYRRCRDSLEFAAWLDASCAVADEFCADLTNAAKKPPEHLDPSSSQGQCDQQPENQQAPQTIEPQQMNAASGQQLTINL